MDTLSSYQLPVAQGLIDAGVVNPPNNAPFMQNGRIVIDDPQAHGQFVAWWNGQSSEVTPYETEARAQFTEITSDHEDEIDKFSDD